MHKCGYVKKKWHVCHPLFVAGNSQGNQDDRIIRRDRLALEWRGLVDRHLQNGVLAPVIEDYASFDRGIYAVLTARGRGHPLAQQFMDCLTT
jgi:hypothetical protein